jgi:phosphosulfolactate phosphohydrolase-like enzyme
VLENDPKPHRPFTAAEVEQLKQRLVPKGESFGFSKEDWACAEAALLSAMNLMETSFNTPDNQQRARSYARIAFGALEHEMSGLSAQIIELKYLQNIWHEAFS